jgi:hypothetical protein
VSVAERGAGAWDRGLILIPTVLLLLAAASTPGTRVGILGIAFALGWAQLPGL